MDAALEQGWLDAVELAEEGFVVGVHGGRLREAEPLRVGGQRLVLGPYGFEQPRGVGILHGQAAERKAQIRTHAAPGVPALVDGAGPVEAGAHRLRPPVGQRAQACFFRLLHEGGQQLGAAGGIGAAGERVE